MNTELKQFCLDRAVFKPRSCEIACLLLALQICSSPTPAAVAGDEQWDFRFGRSGLDGTGLAAVWFQGDLIVGGAFSTAGSARADMIARWDGDDWWPLGEGFSSPSNAVYAGGVYALAVYEGALYAGGNFTRSGTDPVGGLARWTGSNWEPVEGLSGMVLALASEGGALYVGGALSLPEGTNWFGLARWAGSAWETFDSALTGWRGPGASAVQLVAVNGREVFVAGDFETLAGQPIEYSARWDGTGWRSFPILANGTPWALGVHGGELYASGYFTSIGGVVATNIARWDGSQWWPVGPGLDGAANHLLSDESGLYAAGVFTHAGDQFVDRVARWDGQQWQSVGAGLWRYGNPQHLALDPSGHLYAVGYFETVQGLPAGGAAVWDGVDGVDWRPLTPDYILGIQGSVGFVFALCDGGDSVYAAGLFTHAGQVPVNRIARLDSRGWSPLGEGIGPTSLSNARLRALAAQGSNVYAGGTFTNAGAVATANITRWDGTAWWPVGGGVNSNVHALAVCGTNLYVAGSMTRAGETEVNSVACWNGIAWQPLGSGVNATALALAAAGSAVYVGGGFTHAGDVMLNHIGRWDGTGWQPLGTGVTGSNAHVQAIAVGGTNVFVGGRFTTAGTAQANNVALWDGLAWSALGTGDSNGIHGTVYALAVIDGKLFAGGSFTNAGGLPVRGLASWDGHNWSALGSGLAYPAVGSGPRVLALLSRGDDLVVGGGFAIAGSHCSANLARWVENPTFRFGSPVALSTNRLQVLLHGAAGLQIGIEASEDLEGWTPLTFERVLGDPLEFTDPDSGTRRFYRAVLKP